MSDQQEIYNKIATYMTYLKIDDLQQNNIIDDIIIYVGRFLNEKLQKDGFDTDKILWWQYTHTNLSFDLTPPFIEGKYHWWIIKLLPGNFLPMHVDPCGSLKNSNRYWIPFTDWEPGHVFMYENTVLTDYIAGDMYKFENPMALHGSCNIGTKPRIVLQVTTYDE